MPEQSTLLENIALAVFVALPVALAFAARWWIRRSRAQTSAERPHGIRLVVGNVLVLLFLASVALLGTECWLRFAYDGTDTFGLLRTTDRWFARHWQRNSDSFRDDHDYDLGPVPEGMRRVTFLGDSFTTGHGVADVRDRFAQRVRDAHAAWEVHVFALNGWDTGQQAGVLADHVPTYTEGSYRSDVVVLVYCLNDICDIDPDILPLGKELWEARQRGVLTRSSYAFDTLRFLWIASTNADVRGYFPHLAELYRGDVWRAQSERLDALPEAAAAIGARFAVVTFPMLHELGDAYPLRAAHATLAEHWESRGVPHLDLLPTFEGLDPDDLVVGAFDAHPNEHAHALAADAIAPFIEAVLAR